MQIGIHISFRVVASNSAVLFHIFIFRVAYKWIATIDNANAVCFV